MDQNAFDYLNQKIKHNEGSIDALIYYLQNSEHLSNKDRYIKMKIIDDLRNEIIKWKKEIDDDNFRGYY